MRRSGIPTALVAAALVMAGLVAGCVPPCPETMISRRELVAEYNANADRVPSLWARAELGLRLPGVPGTQHADGLILLGKRPEGVDFVLVGRRTGQEIFRVGTSVDQQLYYFWYRVGDKAGAWYGRQALAGAAGVKDLPIDPNDLLSVLSICRLPGGFTTIPAVAVTMQPVRGDCAYVLSYLDRQPDTGEILFRREMYIRWSDTEPRRCYKIRFFDASGMAVLTAKLSDYQPIDGGGEMPTDIRIDWPARQSSLSISLTEMTSAPRGNPAGQARFNPPVPPDQVISVDAHLTQANPQGTP